MKRWMPPAALLLVAACTSAPLTAPAPCPETWTGQAPEEATVDGSADMLVPGTPAGALMCAYPGDNMTEGETLAGQRNLSPDETARMARDLNQLPAGPGSSHCTLAGGPETNYLVRVDYAGGERLWLTTGDEVNSCTDTANGSFRTGAYLGKEMTAAYRTGKWTTPRREDPCHRSLGRRGQEFEMVPGHPADVGRDRLPGPPAAGVPHRQAAVDVLHGVELADAGPVIRESTWRPIRTDDPSLPKEDGRLRPGASALKA